MTRALLTLAAALLAAPGARADMGPFIPVAKHARTTVSRIEVADDLPEYVGVFVRNYGPPKPSAEYEFVPLARGTVIEFAGVYHDRAELVIVPRAAAGPYPDAKALREAVYAKKVLAVVDRTFWSRETVPEWAPPDVTLTYQVRAGATGPVVVRTSRSPLWQWYVAALALTAGMVLGGLWLVRRLFRRRGAQSATALPSSDR